MSRKSARETAVTLLYQADIHKENLPIIDFFEESQAEDEKGVKVFAPFSDDYVTILLSNADIQYIRDVVDGVSEHNEKIQAMVEANSAKWKIERISKIDLAIIKLSIYEMLFREDVPISVSINEAVDIAKKFDTQKAGAYVNGVLGAIAKEINGEQKDEFSGD